MKALAALALLGLSGCAACMRRDQLPEDEEAHRRAPVVIVLCVFASCREIGRPATPPDNPSGAN